MGGGPPSPLEFDHLRSGLDQPNRIAQRRLDRLLIAAERHVGDDPGTAVAARHALGVVDHLIHGDRQCAGMTLEHHPERIAHQQHIDACGVEDVREQRVVAREHRDLFAGRVHLPKPMQSHGFANCHARILPDDSRHSHGRFAGPYNLLNILG